MDDLTMHEVREVKVGIVDRSSEKYDVQKITIFGRKPFQLVLFSEKGKRKDEEL